MKALRFNVAQDSRTALRCDIPDQPIIIRAVLPKDTEVALLELQEIENDLECHERTERCSRAMVLHIGAVKPDGLPVTLRVDRDGIFTWFGGLFEEFNSVPEAMLRSGEHSPAPIASVPWS